MKEYSRKTGYILGLIAYVVFLLWLASIDYYLFHLIAEISTFMLSFTLTIFVLLSIKTKNIEFIKPIALGLFLSSILLMIHTLMYESTGPFGTFAINESLQFWILGNTILAFSFLYTVVAKIRACNFKAFTIGMLLVTVLGAALIFLDISPDMYREATGLTNTKKALEIFIVLLYLTAIIVTLKTRRFYKESFVGDFIAVLVLLISAEILFTQYVVISDFVNSLGHIIKFGALYILMIGAIQEFIVIPINDQLIDLSSEIKSLKNSFLHTEESSNLFRRLYDDAPLGYQSLDKNGTFITVNDTYARMLGYRKEELIGKKFNSFLTMESASDMKDTFQKFIKRGSMDVIFNMLHRDGHQITVRFLGRIAYKKDGDFKQTHCILMDVSNEVEYQKGMIENKEKLEDIIHVTSEGFFTLDTKGTCISVNDKAVKLLGYDTKTELLGKNLHEMIHKRTNDTATDTLEDCLFQQAMKDNCGSVKNKEEIFWSKKGNLIDVIVNCDPLYLENTVVGVNVSFRDLEVSKNIVHSLISLSYHDSLTGIYNRRYYEEEIKNIDNAANYPLSIIVADVNGLKLINDAFGHYSGDKVLLATVEVFIRHATQKDFIARIGGDEFIIVMTKTTKEEAEKRILDMIEETKNYFIESVQLSISFGQNTKYSAQEDIQEIYKVAEDQMYRMKLHDVPSMRSKTIDTILNTLYEKDQYSEEHSRTVSRLSEGLASYCDLAYDQVNAAGVAGLLHDIGKIVISKDILNKEGKLTDAEYEEIKKHSEIGFRILSSTAELRHLSETVLYHQEWWDGGGYPSGIKGEAIPMMSRIIGIVDAFDAMTSVRLYREKLSDKDALNEIIRCSGTQFDPALVEVFKANFESVIAFKKD